jgi:hypothetical protein
MIGNDFSQELWDLDIKSIAEETAFEMQYRKLRHFVRGAWPQIEGKRQMKWGWHLDCITDHLEYVSKGHITRLLINMPPRHMKSTIVSVCWSAWNWLEDPWLQYLFAAYGQGLTTRDNVKCRHIIQSQWYQKLIRYVVERDPDNWYNGPLELSGDQNAKVRYLNNYGGYRIATSVDGAATGEGGDHIVCDDPNNVKQTESDVIRTGINTWFDETMQSRLNDPNKSTFTIVQQRTHESDLSGHVKVKYGDALEIEDGYHMLILPGRYEGNKLISNVLNWKDPRNE